MEARGCEVLFLPAYSPGFSPIEGAFPKLKALLRRARARTKEALVGALGRALDAIAPEDARGWGSATAATPSLSRHENRCRVFERRILLCEPEVIRQA